MTRRRAFAIAFLPVCGGAAATGCGWSSARQRSVDWDAWQATLAAELGAPVVVYVWAPWSRRSVELAQSIAELERVWEARPVRFLYLNLEPDESASSRRAAERLLDMVAAGGERYRLAMDLAAASESLGVPEPPAALVYGPDGRLRHLLVDETPVNPLLPADIADAIESVLTLETPPD